MGGPRQYAGGSGGGGGAGLPSGSAGGSGGNGGGVEHLDLKRPWCRW